MVDSLPTSIAEGAPNHRTSHHPALHRRYNEHVYITDYSGVDLTGTADSAAALQAAIDDLEAAGGGQLHIPAGAILRVDTMPQVEVKGISIVADQRPHLGGLRAAAHAGEARIRAGAAIAACLFVENGSFHARNIVFDANDTATHAVICNEAFWSHFEACIFTQATSHGCRVDADYGSPGVTGGSNNYIHFDHCTFSENGAAGCYVKKTVDANVIHFDRCNARNNVTDGLIVGGTNTHIEGGHYSFNTGYGIRLGLAADPASQDTVIAPTPYVEGNTAGGVKQDNHSRCIIVGVGTGFAQGIDRTAGPVSIIQIRPNAGIASGRLEMVFGDADSTTYRIGADGIAAISDQANVPVVLIPKGSGAIRYGTASALGWFKGSGSPEGAVAAPIGSLYSRTDGGAGTTLYVKESGAGTTGWVAK